MKGFRKYPQKPLGKEITENYSESVQELNSSYSAVGCNVSLKLHFLHSLSDFFLKTWEPSPMDMAVDSIRVFPKLKRCRVENEVQICWLTTAGVL